MDITVEQSNAERFSKDAPKELLIFEHQYVNHSINNTRFNTHNTGSVYCREILQKQLGNYYTIHFTSI